MSKDINNNGYDYVDLGLPSGTLWATMNVGASNPSDYGLYFQWGDTIGYTKDQVGKDKQFNFADYKWNSSGDGEAFTKYENLGDTLDLDDDAAHVNMGGDWHMPMPAQIQELLDDTTRTWTTSDGISGVTFTSKKDASKFIFIPAAGFAWDGIVGYNGLYGYIWSSMIGPEDVYYGKYLSFNLGYIYLNDYKRYYGRSIRGVIG